FAQGSGQIRMGLGYVTFELSPPFEEMYITDQSTVALPIGDDILQVVFTPLFLVSHITSDAIAADLDSFFWITLRFWVLLILTAAGSSYVVAWLKHRNEIADRVLLHQKQAAVEKSRLASLGEMAAGVAHEINNPLSIISMNAELLQA